MKRWPNMLAGVVLVVALTGADASAQRGPSRGPGGGGNDMRGGRDRGSRDPFGGWGDPSQWRRRWDEDQQKRRAEASARETREKAEALTTEGWTALKAGDPVAALDSFSDALQILPEHSEAKLGVALSRAVGDKWQLAQASLEQLLKDKDPKVARLSAYNLGVLFAKVNQKPRGSIVLHRYLEDSLKPKPKPAATAKPATPAAQPEQRNPFDFRSREDREREEKEREERAKEAAKQLEQENVAFVQMVVNAQYSMIGSLDDTQRKAMGLLPSVQKTLIAHDALAAASHKDMERFGMAWVPSGTASQLRAKGVKDVIAVDLPIMVWDGSVLPPKGGKALDPTSNELLPAVADARGQSLVSQMGAIASATPRPSVTVNPVPTPSVTPPTSVSPVPTPSIAPPPSVTVSPVPSPSITPPATVTVPPATPTTPAPVDPGPAPAVAAQPEPRIDSTPVTTTVRGAAFSIGNGMLVTAARLVGNAESVTIVDPEGTPCKAEVVAVDAASGVALLKSNEGRFTAMALGAACKAGGAQVLCFVRAGVFGPEMDVLPGTVTGGGDKFTVRMSTHPRSAGSPVVDATGAVIAMVVANRDDALAALPVVSVEAIRKLCDGKATLAQQTGGAPDECVAEVIVTRRN